MTRASGAHWLPLFSANWYSSPSSAFCRKSEEVSQAHCIRAFLAEPETADRAGRPAGAEAAAFLEHAPERQEIKNS
jgi:hypothetical protein